MSIHDGGCCDCCCAGVARIAEALIAIANPPQHFHRFPWNDNKKQKNIYCQGREMEVGEVVKNGRH